MATIDEIIDAALTNADHNQDYTDAAVAAAIAAATIQTDFLSWDKSNSILGSGIQNDSGVDNGDVGKNVVQFSDLPAPNLDLDDIILKYDTYANTDELAQSVNTDFTNYINTWFPDCQSTLANACNKLNDWIVNGGTGIDPTILNQIWDRQRRSEDVLAQRERDAAVDAEARRGWSLPQGATQNRIFMADQAVINRMADLNRQITIDEATREQENIRFAIQTVVTATLQVHSAAVQFVEATIRGKLLGLQNVQELGSVAARFYEQSVNYFNARVRAEALNQDYERMAQARSTSEKEVELREKGYDVDALVAQIRNRTQAAIAAARVFGSNAAAALSSTNSMVTKVVNESA